ncbi:lysylphosphatidylglycerol synthase domain-containing protein [Kineococcus gynurae]|uniref:Lysylphosphatidylglycerol synthase domain-containing protein n=1 Tax=Kineococcus gynurae TaxID=452979 RepID=A0ABV5LSF7_9ACTN
MEGDQDEAVVGGGHVGNLPRRPLLLPRRFVLGLASFALAGVCLWQLPRLVGTTWEAVLGLVDAVPGGHLLALAALWGIGLWSYSWTLTGALPGLSQRRALLLNLTGSAVSNVLPAGGAFGVWLNTSMLRRWGFGFRRIADFTITSNVFDVIGKLGVCGAALAATALLGRLPAHVLAPTAGVVALVAVAATLAAVAFSRSGSAVLARRVAAVGRRRVGLRRIVRCRREALALRGQVRRTIRGRWRPLTAGVVSYVLLQGVLFGACLHLTAAVPTLSVLVVAFVVDRLVSSVPLTPAGAGFAEAGAAGVLLAGGAAPGAAVAGVLLYRAFVVLLEVPVGGAALAGWWALRRRRRGRLGAEAGAA